MKVECVQQTDATLIRQTLEGDKDSFGVLVERYRDRLFGLAFHLCGDYDTASDLTQDAFVTAYQCLDRIREPSAFASWLAGILRNKSRNLGRKNPAGALSLDQLMAVGFDPPAVCDEPDFSEEATAAVAEYVSQLPAKYRETLVMRYVGDCSYKEMAELLGLPVTTVTTRLNYARKLLIQKAKEGGLR